VKWKGFNQTLKPKKGFPPKEGNGSNPTFKVKKNPTFWKSWPRSSELRTLVTKGKFWKFLPQRRMEG